MVEIRMIKDMPDFQKGEVFIMNNKEAAKMWVEEGVAEYVEEPKKKAIISRNNKENKKKTTSNDETPIKEKKSSQNSSNEFEELKEWAEQEHEKIFQEYKNSRTLEEIIREFDFFNSNLEDRKEILNGLFEYMEQIGGFTEQIDFILDKLYKRKVGEIRQEIIGTYNKIKREISKISFTIFIIKNNIQVYKVSQRAKEHYIILYNNSLSELLHTSHLILNIEMLYKHYTSFMIPPKLDIVKTLIDLHLIKNIYDKGFKPNTEKLFYDENKLYLNEYEPSKLEVKYKNTTFKKRGVKELLNENSLKFETINKIFKHIVGDREVFFKDNLELIRRIKRKENPIYEEMFEKKKEFFLMTFKHDDINKLEKIFEQELIKITDEDKKTINRNLEYLYKWLGFLLQEPTQKLPSGVGIFSEKGIGKDFIKDYILGIMFGSHSITSISQEILNEKFNGYAYAKRLIFCNELSVEASKISMHEKLKEQMTNPVISVRKMHQDAVNMKNYAHYLFFSNRQNMLLVEKGDRRFTIFEQKLKLPDLTIYKINNSYLNINNLPNNWLKEIEEFYKFLMSIDVNYFQVNEPISTEIKNKMIDYTKSDVEQFIEYCKISFNNPIEMIEFFAHKNSFIANHIKIETYKQDKKNEVEYYVFRDSKLKEFISYDLLFQCFLVYKDIANIKGNRNQNSFIKEIIGKSETMWDSVNKKTSKYFLYKEILFEDLTNYGVK